MRRPFPLLFPLFFLLLSSSASSAGPKIKDAQWACPSDIKVNGKSYKYFKSSVFGGPPEKLGQLRPESRVYAYRDLEGRDPYLVCEYKGLEQTLLIHAKGATFCGLLKNTPILCWTGPSP
jgi:hypothetical protein